MIPNEVFVGYGALIAALCFLMCLPRIVAALRRNWSEKQRVRAEDATRRKAQAEIARREAEEQRMKVDSQRDREAARKHLAEFCRKHALELGDAFPPELAEAYLRSRMRDGRDGEHLWTTTEEKIAA